MTQLCESGFVEAFWASQLELGEATGGGLSLPHFRIWRLDSEIIRKLTVRV